MRTTKEKAITACSVAGGGWLIRPDRGQVAWVDTAAGLAAPGELERIASLGRTLILSRDGRGVCLHPGEQSWLLAKPRRIACLIDFLAASEDLVRVLTTPLRITFTPMGEVRWRFVPTRRDGFHPIASASLPAHRPATRMAA
jgi:hypothetical protein